MSGWAQRFTLDWPAESAPNHATGIRGYVTGHSS
jgi:hypothetical protein